MGRLGNLPGTSFNQDSRKEDLCVVWASQTSSVSPYLRTNLSILTLNSSKWGKICKKLSKQQQHPYFGEVGVLEDTVSRKSSARTLYSTCFSAQQWVWLALCVQSMAPAWPEVALDALWAFCKHLSTSDTQQEESGVYRSPPWSSSLCIIAGPQCRFQSFWSCSWKAYALASALFSPNCMPAMQTPHSFEAILPKNLPSGRLQSFPLGLVALLGEEEPERETDLGFKRVWGDSNAKGLPFIS